MPTHPGRESKRVVLAAIGIALLSLLCCGLPLLITAGALGAVGSVLGNPWVIVGAIVLVLGVIVWRVPRFARTTRDDQCCAPPAAHSGPTAHRRAESDGHDQPDG